MAETEIDYNPFGTPMGSSPGKEIDYDPHAGGDPVTRFLRGIPGIAKSFARPVTDYFPTQKEMAKEGYERMGGGIQDIIGAVKSDVKPSARPRVGPFPTSEQRGAAGLVGTALGAVEHVTSPYNAFLRTFLGKPVEGLTGIPKEYTEFAASFGIPMFPKRIPTQYTRQPPVNRQAGVTLSEGEAMGDLPMIQREQAAVRGTSGPLAAREAAAFQEQRARELPESREAVLRGMSPEDTIIARTPQEAAEKTQQTLAARQAEAKAETGRLFTEAKAQPGMIRSEALDELPSRIPIELASRQDPVILGQGSQVSQVADKMLEYLQGVTGRLRAAREGAEGPTVTGLTLQQVENERRILGGMRQAAWGVNATEGRAASAVMEAFDNAIDRAVKSGQFTGSPEAVAAWNRARAAHAETRGTFGDPRAPRSKDPVGHVVQQIIGDNAATGNTPTVVREVVNHLFGAAGTTPSSLNVGVVTRLRNIFGENSPEWVAVKQGLFSKLTEHGEGMAEMGPKMAADRLLKFLNTDGREMSQVLFSPSERSLMKDYAEMQRRLQIPQAGANWSNTATFTGQTYRMNLSTRIMQAIGDKISLAIGASMMGGSAHLLGELGLGAAGVAGATAAAQKVVGLAGQAREAAHIRRQMPVINRTMSEFDRATRAYGLSPSQYNVQRMTLATTNLNDALERAGIQVPELRGGQQ
jgi:hypothetical protein